MTDTKPPGRAAAAPRRRGGRPLSFDREAALHRAMLAFWRHGYETTSIVDLTGAMGITAPSLYAAFGDKKRLFLEAMRRYAGDPEEGAAHIRDAATARDAAADLLRTAVKAFTGDDTPKGCLLASATATGSVEADDVRQAVAAVRAAVGDSLRARIERDVADGVLPATTRPEALAGLVLSVVQGLSVLARDGLSRANLAEIADAALAAWPAEHRRSRRVSRTPPVRRSPAASGGS